MMPALLAAIPLLGKLLERVLPDPAQQVQAQLKLFQMIQNGELAQLQSQTQVITAEEQSGNKLASSWRPMLMYVFMAIIANNYIIAPYLQAMFHVGLTLSIPTDMWDLLKLGVGGYVVGRSVEKAVDSHAQGRVGAAQALATTTQSSDQTSGGN
jgi:hypothetical protein